MTDEIRIPDQTDQKLKRTLGLGSLVIFGLAQMSLSTVIFTVKEPILIHVYSRFRLIYVLLIAVSLVVYFLVSFGISMPYYIVPPPPETQSILHIIFILSMRALLWTIGAILG